MDSKKITTTSNNIIIVRGASCVDGFLTLPLENDVNKLAEKTKHGNEFTRKTCCTLNTVMNPKFKEQKKALLK